MMFGFRMGPPACLMDTGTPLQIAPGVELCRGFSPGANRALVEYRFFATGCYEPIPPGQMRCDVCADSGGRPGQVLTSVTNNSALDYGTCSISLPSVALNGSGRYWVRLSHIGDSGVLEVLQGSLMPFWAADHKTQVYIDGNLAVELPRFAGVLVFGDGYIHGIDQASAGSLSVGVNNNIQIDLVNPLSQSMSMIGIEAAVVSPPDWTAVVSVGSNVYKTDSAYGSVALFPNVVSIPASTPFSVRIEPADVGIVTMDGDLFDMDIVKMDSFLRGALFGDSFKMRVINRSTQYKAIRGNQIMLIALRLKW